MIRNICRSLNVVILVFIGLIVFCNSCPAYPLEFKDGSGKTVTVTKPPERVVSLVPSVTEILFELGVDTQLKGITYHTVRPWKASQKALVGGFFQPDIAAIEALHPDVIFLSSIHLKVLEHFKNSGTLLVNLKTDSVAQSHEIIRLLGNIFDRETAAKTILNDIQSDTDLIKKKLGRTGTDKKRVIRLMGRDTIMTPGSDSFQSELISLAGGIPPDFGNGDVIPVSKEDWFQFNPQVIYGCGKDSQAAEKFFSLPVWKDVDAVKNGRIYYFPCDLTCRAATHTGYFIKWLASSIYGKEFGSPGHDIEKNRIVGVRPLDTTIGYVKSAAVKESVLHDFINRSLVIELDRPMKVISTLEGPKQGVTAIGNHYIPPQSWLLNHDQGLEAMKTEILSVLKLKKESASFLFTGADMNNLCVKEERFKEILVKVFATAGVDSNAMRVSKDTGGYYEPGTINLIVMTNHQLTPRAMTRAIIAATEGKTAALLDLDIRSSYQDGRYRATGTGTDNVMVVEGRGNPALTNAGGHTKLGELIGRCVYNAVTGAIKNQNAITVDSNIFWRLKKRGITIYSMVADRETCDCNRPMNEIVAEVESLLLKDDYKGFMESALAVSDDYDKGLIKNLALFDDQCQNVARMISNRTIEEMKPIITRKDVPLVIGKAVNALFNGVYYRSMIQ